MHVKYNTYKYDCDEKKKLNEKLQKKKNKNNNMCM